MESPFGRLSWGNMYKKFEIFYNDGDLVQIPRKYADNVGKHVKNIIGEVVGGWADHPGECTEGVDTELWMDALTSNVDFTSSIEVLEGRKLDVPNFTDMNLKASDVEKLGVDKSCQLDHCEGSVSQTHTEKTDAAGASSRIHSNCENSHENSLASSTPLGGLLDAVSIAFEPLASAKALTCDGCHDGTIETSLVPYDSDSHAEICGGIEEPIGTPFFLSHAEGCEDRHEHKFKFQKSEDHLTGSLVGLDRGECFDRTTNYDLNMELNGKFQEIDLKETWDDDEEYILELIALHESRQRSFRKNFRAAFISKLHSLKEQIKTSRPYSRIGIRKLDSRVSQTPDKYSSEDFDWELV